MEALELIVRDLGLLANDGYCADPVEMARDALQFLTPPEQISTTDCVVKYRYIKNPEGSGKRLWSLDRTPYMAGPHASMDSPRYRMTIVVGPERSGKALDADTKVATPSGWSTMGQLRPGDEVFSEDGSPTKVVAISGPQHGRKCFRVIFSDGAEIISDVEHLWKVQYQLFGGREGEKTITAELGDLIPIAFKQGSKGKRNLLSVKNADPLQCQPKSFDIEPYTFGAWLGDGTARTGDITLHMKDAETLDHIRKDGYEVQVKSKPSPDVATVKIMTPADRQNLCNRGHDKDIVGRYDGNHCRECNRQDAMFRKYGTDRAQPRRKDTFRARLEGMGVLSNKHVPKHMLRGSFEQRLALLQGWMDTDGHADPRQGRCELVTVEPQLALDAVELVCSLGLKPTMTIKAAYAVKDGVRIRGRDAHRICFSARGLPVFRLARKLAVLQAHAEARIDAWHDRRRIVKIEEVESRVVCCIRVDHPSGMFLAGERMIPTHNSVGGENYLFKCLRNGPLTDAIIYLQAGVDCDSYADKEFQWFVELHPEISNKLGPSPSDRKRRHKKFSGRSVQILPANDGNLRQKEAQLIIATEIDGYKRTAAKAVQEIRGRQKSFGNKAKAYIESHPDLGWEVGIAHAWKDGTRGIPYWQCPECGGWSTPHQLAPKGMRSVMFYTRDNDLDDHGRATRAEETARLLCPTGCLIDDENRYRMIDGIVWIHDGQTISAEGEITGEIRPNETASFWIHGLNVKRPLAPLAREHLNATIHFERTRKPDNIKRFTVKSLGEVYEGANGQTALLAPEKLIDRAKESGFDVGTAPAEVMFVTAAVDPGGSKFDISIYGWDLEGRSWLIDRITMLQRRWPDGVMRNLRPAERIEDWDVLRTELLDRLIPLADDPTMALPIAGMSIDTGDGHVTWKAREFARRMSKQGYYWGPSTARWERVRLIKGAKSPDATELPVKGRDIDVDDEGKSVAPVLLEYDLGVHKLKTLSVERLVVIDGMPGQCFFARGLPKSTFAEFTGEKLVDEKWERSGPNESLDLFGYAEAVRLMLRPDRADIKWDVRRPVWARPVPIRDDGVPASAPTPATAPTKKLSIYERMDQGNRKPKRNG